jgi:hypothetical protein
MLGLTWLPQGTALPAPRMAVYTSGYYVFLFFAIAFLSGSLADRLQHAGMRLERASTEIADLQAFNQHVIDSLTSGLATTDQEGPHPHVQPHGRNHHGPFRALGDRPPLSKKCLDLPPNVAADLNQPQAWGAADASRRPITRRRTAD